MNREQIIAVLYDMALVIGGEVNLQPLLIKTLQRLLYHTGFPCGMIFLYPKGEPPSGELIDMLLETAIGDYELARHLGTTISVPTSIIEGGPLLFQDRDTINKLPCRKDRYSVYLRLPIPDCGVIILISAGMPETETPLTNVFQPVMNNLARAINLCQKSEAYTKGIILERDRIEHRHEILLKSLGEGVYGVDTRGATTFVNPAAAKMLGFEPDELIGRYMHNIIHHTRADGAPALPEECPIYMSFKDGKLHYVPEDIFWRKDGTSFYVDYVSAPVMEGETVIGSVVAFQDITERKKTEEEIRRNMNLFTQGPAIVFKWVNREGWPVEYVSPNITQEFGYQPEDLINGKIPYASIVYQEDLERVAAEVKTYSETGATHFRQEYRIIDAYGKIRWLDDYTIVVRNINGEITHYDGYVLDITERKRAEDKIREEMELTKHLLKIAEATANTTDIDRLMEEVTLCGHSIAGCDICLGYLWDKEAGVFLPTRSCGLPREIIPLFKTEPIDGDIDFVRQAFEGNKPSIVMDSSLEPFVKKVFPWIKGVRAIACVPLIGREGYLGIIFGIFTKDFKLTEKSEKIMAGVSHQVSIALENAMLYKDSVGKAMELSHMLATVQTMYEIDRSILSTLKTDEVLEISVRMLSNLLPCDSAMVMLADKGSGVFVYKAGFNMSIPSGRLIPFAETSAGKTLVTQMPEFFSDLGAIETLHPFEKLLHKEGLISLMRLPIVVKGDVAGILGIGAKRPGAFTPLDRSTLARLVNQVGVALENARLVSDLEGLFLGVLKSLSSAIDAKSHWTAGHSERVTSYALMIGKEMGFSEKELKDLEIASILHDIGKIGTYEAILDKNDKLTAEELALMHQHPAKGAEILAPIKQLRDIIPIIRSHQEMFDGSGYPDGLKGEEIPLLARILMVADTFDSMTSDRPYRAMLGTKDAIEEIKRFSGIQFDPKIAGAFIRIFQRGDKTG